MKQNSWKKKKLIIFDLDDTLYLESEYVMSGFYHVAVFFSFQYKIKFEDAYNFLVSEFESNGREKIFDKLFYAFDVNFNTKDLSDLILVYRKHIPRIKLSKYNITILEKLNYLGIKIGIVTDGLSLMQKNKIKALGLEKWADYIVYCWEIGAPKPDTKAFINIINKGQFTDSDVLIIGDNPNHDIVAANKINVNSYRVLTGRFKYEPDLDLFPSTKRVNSLHDIFGDLSDEN